MQSVLMLLRVHRAALRAWVSVAVLLAVIGGVVLALGAGARRTDTAYPRFLGASNPPDVLVTGSGTTGNFDDQSPVLHRIEALPQVAQAGIGYWALVAVRLLDGRVVTGEQASTIVLPDARYGRSIGTFKPLEGRLADPRRPDEVTVAFPFADQFHLHAGDSIEVQLATPKEIAALLASGTPTAPSVADVAGGDRLRMRITGVMASPISTDFPPLPPGTGGAVYFTPAFLAQTHTKLVTYGALVARLRHGQADVAAFERDAEAIATANDTQLTFQATDVHEAVVQSTLHLQALGLGVLAALAAAVLLLVLGQGVTRRILIAADDSVTLRALGVSRPQLWAADMARAGLAALAGASGAVLIAFLLSPLTPVGNARLAEPAPGFDLDWAIVVGGALALALVVMLMAALPAWRLAGTRRRRTNRMGGHRLGDLLARAGLPATATSGVRLALDPGRGRRAVPVRSAVFACAVGAATVAAAITFSASLGHLLDSPRLYGWNWDWEVSGLVDATHAPALLDSVPSVTGYAMGVTADLGIDGDRAGSLAMDPGKGEVGPVILSGHMPRGDDEILLGSRTDTDAQLGHTVEVHVGNVSRPMRLVGRGVLPILGDTSHLGTGAWLTFAGLRRLVGDAPGPANTFLVRTTGAAAHAQLVRTFGGEGVFGSETPTGVVGFGDLSALPLVLAAVLAAGAVATLAHAIVTSVRRRARDLAMLKTLGFVRSQVTMTVAWQATTVAALAALIGVPVGAAAGRWAWTVFASQQGLLPDPVLPFAALLLVVPAALLLANLVAAIPGRYAARTSPALVLRSE
jgi:hypothetical protein